MSKAAKDGTYSDLHQFYINGKTEQMKNKTMSYFEAIQQLKHNKEDFIKSCSWKNTNCTADDFKEQLTDFGVCYTFNGYNGSTKFRTISQTGAQYGLQLLLNTETYEAMAGPHGYGGVKVQVHHPMADPQVQDQGLNIPPQMSAFIGMTMEEANFLEPPHGKCSKVPPVLGGSLAKPDPRGYSKSKCETECFAFFVNASCHCVSSYMPMLVGSKYCSLYQEKTCAQNIVDQVKTTGACTNPKRCPYNCRENFYQAFVTYAAMSESELIRLAYIHRSDTAMTDNYRNATVLRHQLVNELYEKEKLLVFESGVSLEKIMKLVTDDEGMNKSLQQWETIISRDIKGESNQILTRLSQSTTVVRRTFDDMFSLSSILTFLLNHMIEIQYGQEILRRKTDYYKEKSDLNQGFDFHKSTCIYWERELEGKYLTIIHLLPKTSEYIREVWNEKENEGNGDATVNVWLSHAQQYAPLIIDSFGNLVQDYKKFADYMRREYCVRARSVDPNPTFNEEEKNEAAGNATQFLYQVGASVNASTRAIRNTDENMNQQSSEIQAVATALKQRENMLSIRLKKAQDNLAELEELFRLVYPIFNRFKQDFLLGRPPSKLDMLTQLDHAMPDDKPAMLSYFSLLVKQITDDLEQFLQTMRDTDDIVTAALGVLPQSTDLDRVGTLMANTRPYQMKITQMLNEFNRLAENFDAQASSLDGRLRITFNASIEVDMNFIKNNFIQVNLFFQSLTYSTVSRQPGYTWFGLLCDCGGSAGLYLGASMLSIFELVYFLCKFIKATYKERQLEKKENDQSDGF